MKKLLFLCILILGFINGWGQSFNIAHHSFADGTGDIVSINSRSFYIEKCSPLSIGHDSLNIVGVDKFGKIFFKKRIDYNEVNLGKKLKVTRDKCLSIVGFWTGCDYSPTGAKNFLIKIDTNGNQIFSTYPGNLQGGDEFKDYVQGADSLYYLFTAANRYRCSKTGSLVSSGWTFFTDITAVSYLNNNNLLLSCKSNSVLSLAETNTNAISVNEKTVSSQFTKLDQGTNAVIFGLTSNNTIESYSTNLSLLNSSVNFLSQTKEITDFVVRNDSVFITGFDSVTRCPFYGILNAGLSSIYFSQSNYPHIIPTGITINKQNKIRIITTSPVPGSFGHVGFYQMPINGGFISNSDIGVTKLSLISNTVFLAAGGYWSANDLSVTVKNFGADTVKSFYLNSFGGYTGFIICKFEYFHKLYNVTIPPNDSIAVTASSVIVGGVAMSTVVGTPITATQCVYSTVPNHSNDKNDINDSKCSVLNLGTAGIETHFVLKESIKLFPNPTSSKITIECEAEMKNLILTDVLGREIIATSPEYKKAELNLSNSPEGIYFVRIETEKGIVVRKIIRD